MSMDEGVQRELGNLEARVVILEGLVSSIGSDVKHIRSRTDRASGLVMLIMLCVPAALAATVTWLISR